RTLLPASCRREDRRVRQRKSPDESAESPGGSGQETLSVSIRGDPRSGRLLREARPAVFIDRGPAMHLVVLLWAGLLTGDVRDYSRSLDAKKLDQATLDSEGYGEKKVLKREAEGLRITLGPGEAETGWKIPQALRIGGDFTIAANFI